MSSNPMALRELVSVDKDDSVIIGDGFALPYAMAVFVPSLLYYCMYKTQKIYVKLYLLLAAIIGGALVIRSLYMTALILFITGILYVLIYRFSKRAKVVFLSVLIIIIPSFVLFLPTIMEKLSPAGATVLITRSEELSLLFSGDSISDTDMGDRFTLALTSIKTFFKHPLFGIGWSVNYDFFEMERLGVGSHSEWFDIFARYGIFGSLLIYTIAVGVKKHIKKENITYLFFVILGFLNPIILFPILFVTMFLSPSLKYLEQ